MSENNIISNRDKRDKLGTDNATNTSSNASFASINSRISNTYSNTFSSNFKSFEDLEISTPTLVEYEKDFDIDNTPKVKVGDGSYGDVYKVENSISQTCAYKDYQKSFSDNNDYGLLESSIIREVSILNILKDQEKKYTPYLYFYNHRGIMMDFYDYDLGKIINKFPNEMVKVFIFKILQSLDHAHSHGIVHRDLKPYNILVRKNKNWEDNKTPHNLYYKYDVCLCDWGLSKFYYSKNILNISENVQTLWYRSPEILLQTENYTDKMDIWSLGIIMIEMLLKQTGLLSAKKSRDQAFQIVNFFGYPFSWEDAKKKLESIGIFSDFFSKPTFEISKKLRDLVDPDGLDLIKKMITVNPEERINTKDALRHKYFSEFQIYLPAPDTITTKPPSLKLPIIEINRNTLLNKWRKGPTLDQGNILDRKTMVNKMYNEVQTRIKKSMGTVEASQALKLYDKYLEKNNIINETDQWITLMLCVHLIYKQYYGENSGIRTLLTSRIFDYSKKDEIEKLRECEKRIFDSIGQNIIFSTPAMVLHDFIQENNMVGREYYQFRMIISILIDCQLKIQDLVNYNDLDISKTLFIIIKKLIDKTNYQNLNTLIDDFIKKIELSINTTKNRGEKEIKEDTEEKIIEEKIIKEIKSSNSYEHLKEIGACLYFN